MLCFWNPLSWSIWNFGTCDIYEMSWSATALFVTRLMAPKHRSISNEWFFFSAIWMCHKEKSCQSGRLTWRTWAYLRHPAMPLQRFARMELWSLGAPRKLEATRERSKTSCKMSKRSRRRGVRPGILSSKPQPTAFLARGLIFESVR